MFWSTRDFGFVFDDQRIIVANPTLRDPAQWKPILGLDGTWPEPRALRDVLNLVDYQRGGGAPRPFHETNIVLHGLVCALVFWLGRRVDPRSAGVAALLFAVHPAHADAVAYVSGRKDLLVTLFVLGAVLAFLRFRRSRGVASLLLVLACGLLALLSKEMAVSLPVILLVLDAGLPIHDGEAPLGFREALRRRWPLYGAVLLIALIGAYLTLFVHQISARARPADLQLYGGALHLHLLTCVRVAVAAATTLLLPGRLRTDYSYATITPAEGFGPTELVTVGVLAVLLLPVYARRLPRTTRMLSLAAWVSYLPVSQVIPHHEILSEHTLYLPSAFLMLALAPLVRALAERSWTSRWAVAIVVALLAIRTVDRCQDFRNRQAYIEAAVRTAPESSRAHFNHGELLRVLGKPVEAETAYAEAVRIGLRAPEENRHLHAALRRLVRLRLAAAREHPEAAVDRLAPLFEEARRAEVFDRELATQECAFYGELATNPGRAWQAAVRVLDLSGTASEQEEAGRLAISVLKRFDEIEGAHLARRVLQPKGSAPGPTDSLRNRLRGRFLTRYPELGNVLKENGDVAEAIRRHDRLRPASSPPPQLEWLRWEAERWLLAKKAGLHERAREIEHAVAGELTARSRTRAPR